MAKNEPRVYRQGNLKRVLLRVLLCIFVIIFVLLFLALLGFRKYIAYTDTGKLYLDIPWLEGYIAGPPEYDDLAEHLTPEGNSVTDESSKSPDSEGNEEPQDSNDTSSGISNDDLESPDSATSPDAPSVPPASDTPAPIE